LIVLCIEFEKANVYSRLEVENLPVFYCKSVPIATQRGTNLSSLGTALRFLMNVGSFMGQKLARDSSKTLSQAVG
jgi:hypothetical protein